MARQVSITKIGAHRVPEYLDVNVRQTMEAFLAGPFELCGGLIRVKRPDISLEKAQNDVFHLFPGQAPENWAKQESRDFSAKFLFSRLRINCSSSAISVGLRFSSLWISAKPLHLISIL